MRTLLVLLLLSLPASAGAAKRVIVEFHGAPAAVAGPAAVSTRRETLDRFRRDLNRRISTQSSANAEPAHIRHEYSAVFFGAAVDLGDTDVDLLRELPYVRAVHPDREVRAYATTTGVIDARERVNASGLAARGRNITIAIIDTGIDYMHQDLGGGFGPGFKVAGGYDFVNDDADPMDDHGHGTHVAGIAAANGPALVGVAPEATLIAYKSLGPYGAGSEANVIAAIERSADPNEDGDFSDHHDVINLSLGASGTADDPLSRAADNASAAGVVVVAGAGNEGHSIVSIGSPGNARDAITVGAHDGGGTVASFSSRGPTPALLTFKPDVVAPGVSILSAKLGGGLIAFDGTSMATPHVAGVCALLRELHPDWTPADMKAALTSTALPVEATAYVRGSGRMDAQRAHEAKVFVRSAGLSFGLAPSRTGTLDATRTFTIENRSTAEQTFAVAPPSLPGGIALTITPPAFTLRPGESREVEARLVVDNAAVPFVDDEHQRLVGGTIGFTGTTPLSVPWAVLRSGRVAFRTDAPFFLLQAYAPDAMFSTFLRSYGTNSAETFVVPGGAWDFVVATIAGPEEARTLRMFVIENRAVVGDELISVRAADASLRIALDGRDRNGVPLVSRPLGPRAQRITTLQWNRESAKGVDEQTYQLDRLAALYVSPASSRYSLGLSESLIDLEEMEAYDVQHEPLRGFTAAKTLTRDAAAMIHAKLELEPLGTDLAVCPVSGDLRFAGSSLRRGRCVTRRTPPEGVLDYYATEEVEPLVITGIQIRTSHLTSPPLHVADGAIVGTWDAKPSVASIRIPNGGTATIGTGPVCPYALPGTTGDITPFRPRAGFFGSFDDERAIVTDTAPAAKPGAGYVVTPDGLSAAGHVSRGVLEVSYGPDEADLEPPALTSLRIIDRTGRNVDRLARREIATLKFSAADLDWRKARQTKISKPEATRAWIRMTGTPAWLPLAVVIEGSETGNANDLRHVPAGDLYRADLSSVANGPDALFDLRIEVEDAGGNRATWTQSPAFSVGTVAAPPRRRSVR